jgi:hypothetical protein
LIDLRLGFFLKAIERLIAHLALVPRGALIVLGTLLTGVAGRTLLDGLISQRAGSATIAHWAQLNSVVELTAAIACAGLGPGVTVLVSRATSRSEQVAILRDALWLALALSALTAVVLGGWLVVGPGLDTEGSPRLVWLALTVGIFASAPALAVQAWQAQGHSFRTWGLTLIGLALGFFLVTQDFVLPAPFQLMGTPPGSLLGASLLTSLPILFWYLFRPLGEPSATLRAGLWSMRWGPLWPLGRTVRFRTELFSYLPAGLSIGLLSPVSMIVARDQLGGALGWESAATVQAIWRSSEWSAALLSGMLSLYFLPRMSRAAAEPDHRAALRREVGRAIRWLWLPAGGLLLALVLIGPQWLSKLFSLAVVPTREVLAVFLFAEWIRMGSWVLLQVLFATAAQGAIAAGELLSLPLFAALLWFQAPDLTLRAASLDYLGAYSSYLVFNLLLVWLRLYGQTGWRVASNAGGGSQPVTPKAALAPAYNPANEI